MRKRELHIPGRMFARGDLVRVEWASEGDKPGRSYRADLQSEDGGGLRLTLRASDFHDRPYTVTVYRADDDAMDRLRDMADRYGMTAWADLPPDRDNLALDGLSTSVTLIFSEERTGRRKRAYYSISYESRLPDGAAETLRAFEDCLKQWAVPDRLLETRFETRRGEVIEDPTPSDRD